MLLLGLSSTMLQVCLWFLYLVVLIRIVLLGLLHIYVMFFVHFLHNGSMLLTNPEVLCEEMDLCFVRKKLEKGCVEMLIF